MKPRLQHWRPATWKTAETRFQQHAAVTVLLTRTLLTPLDVPTNVIAGGCGYPFPRFLACDLLGRIIWITIFGSIGYIADSQWSLVSQTVQRYTPWIVASVIPTTILLTLLRIRWLKRGQTATYSGRRAT